MKPFPKNARVVFSGASIVAASNYTLRIADYYRMNLPELNVKFFPAAQAGGSLDNAMRHFKSNVLPFEPTHAVVLIGTNDSRISALNLEDAEKRENALKTASQRYSENLDKYFTLLRSHGIEPIFITIPCYGEFMKAESPVKYAGGFARLAEFAELARVACMRNGVEYCDVHARFAELYMHEELLGYDRIHPTDLGQFRIAQQFLRDQGLDIGEFVSLEALCEDEWCAEWYKNAYRFNRIYGAYTNLPPEDLYDMPYEDQMETVSEYVVTHAYRDSAPKRDFSTEFLVNKPREARYVANLKRLNGDV